VLFKRQNPLRLRAGIILLLAVALMIVDHRYTLLVPVRSILSVVVVPVQYLVSKPVLWGRWLDTRVARQEMLLDQNASLRAEQLLIQAKLQKLINLEKQNKQLRALLQSTTQFSQDKIKVAELLAVDPSPYTQRVVLNEGSTANVYVGQPVLDAYGVMGQVVNVGPLTSLVLLLTDTHSAIPVQDARTGRRYIVEGLGADHRMALVDVPDTDPVKVGDQMVTSGLGLRFPVGYPVGQVMAINRQPGMRFAQITLASSAHMNRSRQVLLVWLPQRKLAKTIQQQMKMDLAL